jgi:hypothetical protein
VTTVHELPLHPIPQITPKAVAIYAKMKRLECLCGPDARHSDLCGRCRTWWDLHAALTEELPTLRPWFWPAVADIHGRADRAASELTQLLEAALRERRRSARARPQGQRAVP